MKFWLCPTWLQEYEKEAGIMPSEGRSLLGTVYYWLWHDVLKLDQPITGITQDEQKANPLLFMLIFLGLGIVVIKVAKDYWWQILIAIALGILIGHLFW